LMLLLLFSLLLFFELCDYSVRFLILLSLLSVVVACLLVVVAWYVYVYACLPRGHPWRSYVVLSSFRLMFRFDHWYHTYQLLFPVSSYRLLFHPVVVPFDHCSVPSTRVRVFRRPSGTMKELSFRWFLIDLQLETLAIAMALSCFADELVRRFVRTDCFGTFRVFVRSSDAASFFVLDAGCNTKD